MSSKLKASLLEQDGAAHRYIEERKNIGKVILVSN